MSISCSAASATAPRPTEHSVMPSWAQASSERDLLQGLEADLGALAACGRQRLELGAAGRHDGELGADEEGVAEQQQEREPQGGGVAHERPPEGRAVGQQGGDRLGLLLGRGRRVRFDRGREAQPVDPAPVHGLDATRPSRGRSHLVADDRHPAEDGHDEAAHRLVRRPVRHRGAEPVADLVGAPQPGHRPRAVGRRPARWSGARSCSSLTSPTISSMTSSRVTTPDVPPYSSTTTASWLPASRSISEQRVEPDRLGHAESRRSSAPRPARRRAARAGTAIARLTWTSPVDVVPVLADDREAGVAGAARQPQRRRRRTPSRSIGGAAHARAHHVGRRALAEVRASA